MTRTALLSVVILGVVACGSSDEVPGAPAITAAEGAPAAPPPPRETTAAPLPVPNDPAPAADPKPGSLRDNRDRLIDTLAARRSSSRCAAWSALTPTQKGVFVTITDLLGNRSYMTSEAPGTKGRFMALDHVTSIYEIRDKGRLGNGGGDNNRIWIQVDAELIAALRAPKSSLPEWGESTDAAGPHDPFDATSETIHGQPRGQAHFWSADASSRPLDRPGVKGVDDPRIVEIDIDYDLFHNSNPEGTYVPGGYGRDKYEKLWKPLGTGDDPELGFVPTGCS